MPFALPFTLVDVRKERFLSIVNYSTQEVPGATFLKIQFVANVFLGNVFLGNVRNFMLPFIN